MDYENCPACDGWGFELLLRSQWEEDEESPLVCIFCVGLGLVPFKEEGKHVGLVS